MLESIYWHAGYEVGAFTSPHLWRFNERIRFNGEDAADEELIELFEIIEPTLGADHVCRTSSPPTVAALLHFARREVDVAILEVGMGGRLDAVERGRYGLRADREHRPRSSRVARRRPRGDRSREGGDHARAASPP